MGYDTYLGKHRKNKWIGIMIKIGEELEGKINMNSSGSAYLVNGELPRDIYIHKNNTNKALHLDNVKIKVIKGNGRELEGIVTTIIKRFRIEFVGTIEVSPRYAFFVPDSNKMPIDIFIPLTKLNGALDGQKVVAKLTDWRANAKSPNGEIIKVLGVAGDNDTEIHSILHEYDLQYNFTEDVLAEAEAISSEITQSDIDSRRDMRNVTTFTIDPVDAKDFDDALSAEWINGELEVGVHIADVSHYLRPDTDLDKEAYRRGTSIYLVDRVIPMLPERLSNGLCSLRPNEDKLCFSVVFRLDKNGNIVDEWFGRTIINSDCRYSYEEAQEVIMTGPRLPETTKVDLRLCDLNAIAKNLRKARMKEGAITFEKQEIRFKLDEKNKPIDIIFKIAKDSNKLIEEFMLLANKRVANFLKKNEFPVVNRVHEEPSFEKLNALKNFINQFGYEIKTNTPAEITRTLNKLLIDVQGKAEENIISSLVVRTMQKAIYTTRNLGHYGLGFDDYTHFTSPIRRYPDVMIHRLLGRCLNHKSTPKVEKLEAKCIYLSERERKAQKAERDSIKYMQCLYMTERIGKVYKGIITSVAEYGLFVEIIESKSEGLVRISDIGGDTFVPDLNNYCVKGYNTGEVIRLGDEVNIVVSSVDVERKNINFTLIRL